MKKQIIFKSALVAAMLVVMVIAFAPAANAISATSRKDGSHNEGVGAGVYGDQVGNQIRNGAWHAGAWTGTGVTLSSLSWTFYGGNSVIDSGTTTVRDWNDLTNTGNNYGSIGASASAVFKYNNGAPYTLTATRVNIP